jgi:flagella basal body P-ring formation protein FlgA
MKFSSLVGRSLIGMGMLSLICLSPSAIADDTVSGAQLRDYVHSFLMSRGLDSRPVISNNRRFRACHSPLEITPMFGGYKTVRLTCPDADGFKIAIRTQIGRFVADVPDIPSHTNREVARSKFVVVTKSLQPGEIIGIDDVILIQRDANPGVGYFSDVDDVVGRKAKKAVTVNKIIRTRHLELDYAIQKDQSVIIESQIGPVTVFGAGTAVNNAQLGDRVRVKNKSSGMVVEGVVISEKKIRIRAK